MKSPIMIQLSKFNVIMVISYWILNSSQFYSALGEKPRCKGEPLSPEKFSDGENVGFVRDICVDIIARTVYNKLGCEVSSACEELANIRTSTCFLIICIKWSRSYPWNKDVTKQIMILAETLMENLIDVVWKNTSLNKIDEELKSIFDIINGAKHRLVKSGAVAKDSNMIVRLNILKKYFCTRCQLKENQRDYEANFQKNEAWTKKTSVSDSLLENSDLEMAVKQLISNLEAENETKISNYFIERVLRGNFFLLSGIVRLKFEYDGVTVTKANFVIIKIPSISIHFEDSTSENSMYRREVLVYQKILPAMYKLGKCVPFSAQFYLASQGSTLVLEDLSEDGYKHNDQRMLDLDQIKITLQVLAQFHALGYAYLRNGIKNDPSVSLIESLPPELNTGISNRKFQYELFCNSVKPHLSAALNDKIWKIKDEVFAYPKNINPPNENTMTVIIHGDMHEGNILMKYDNGKVCQAKIIDWQFARHASPVEDLMDFFINSVPVDTFAANENNLFDFYLTKFNSILSSLSVKREYSQHELNQDMFHYRHNYLRLLANANQKGSKGDDLANWLIYLDRKDFI